jgi:hypothetical protein
MKINDRHKRFAELLVAGKTARAAYMEAFPTCHSIHTADSASKKLKQQPEFRQYLETLRGEIRGAVKSGLVMAMEERRAFLARIIRTPLSEINEGSALCQEYSLSTTSTGGRTEKVKMPCKLRALELDARLAGDMKEKAEVPEDPLLDLLKDVRSGN